MSNLFEHCRTEISSASQRYEKPEAMQINLLFAEAKYSRCSQSAISLCQSAAGGGCAGGRRRSDAALCMSGCGLPLFGCGRRANLSKLYFSRPPACGIALQKQPILISSTSRTSDWVSPARSGFTTFCHQKVAPKVSAGHLRRDRTEVLTERAQKTALLRRKRLHRSDCGGSAKSASGLCTRLLPVVFTPAPSARTAVRSDSSSGAMRRQLCAVRNDNHSFASAHGRSPACRIALRKERKDSYAPLHSARNDKSCHPQEEVQTNSDTGIAPCIAQQTAEKKAVSDRFSAHLPENRKIIRNFAGQSINCRARI